MTAPTRRITRWALVMAVIALTQACEKNPTSPEEKSKDRGPDGAPAEVRAR
jgi:hypothetical protein